jgi:hypothetical protein
VSKDGRTPLYAAFYGDVFASVASAVPSPSGI